MHPAAPAGGNRQPTGGPSPDGPPASYLSRARRGGGSRLPCEITISREVALRSQYLFTVHEVPLRTRPAGLALSLLLHVVIVLVLLIPLRRDFARVLSSGDPLRHGGGGGGGGAGRVAYITLPAPPASAPVAVAVTPPREMPPPVPVTPPTTPPVEIPPPAPAEETPAPPAPVAAATPDSAGGVGPGQGGGAGGGTGGGTGPGTGAGTGPGSGPGAGEGGSGRAPELRHMPIPPDNWPKELRGTQIRVTFWVDEVGKAVRIALDPPIRDRKYANRFTETMLNYKFRPALGPDGHPVASTWTFVVSY